jgi:hypothetical protein
MVCLKYYATCSVCQAVGRVLAVGEAHDRQASHRGEPRRPLQTDLMIPTVRPGAVAPSQTSTLGTGFGCCWNTKER